MATTKALNDLPLEKLIGEPLQAAAKAQLAMAQSNLEAMVKLASQPNQVVSLSKKEGNDTKAISISVPVLAMVEPVNLSIEKLTSSFTFEVSTLQDEESMTSGSLKGSISGKGLLSGLLGVEASGNLEKNSTSKSSYSERGQLNISVLATRTGHTRAMQTILDAAFESISISTTPASDDGQ